MKRVFKIAVAFALIGAVGVGGGLWYRSEWRWPQGNIEVHAQDMIVAGERSEALLKTNQPYPVAVRRGVDVEIDTRLANIHGIELMDDGGKLSIRVDMTALRPNIEHESRLRLLIGGREVASVPVVIRAAMPKFFQDRELAFAEMMLSPADDIYGSDVNLWRVEGESSRWVVAGHAISDVCRRVSSSVWRLAAESDLEAPDFFVGAGFASLRPLLDDKSIRDRLEEFARLHPSAADALRLDLSVTRPSAFRRQLDRIRVDLRDALAELERPAVQTDADDANAFAELLSRVLYSRADARTAEALVELAKDPARGVDLLLASDSNRATPLVQHVRSLTDTDARVIRARLNKMYDMLTTLAEVTTDLDEAAMETGLVHWAPAEHSTVTPEFWDDIQKSVAEHAVAPNAQPLAYMTELSGGHLGVVMLPYFDLSGDPLRFEIDAGLVEDETSRGVLSFLYGSLKMDIAGSARRAAARWSESYDNGTRELQRFVSDAPRDPTVWLEELERFEYQIVDEQGRPTGEIKVEHERRAEHIANRFAYLAECVRSEYSFRSLAESIESDAQNPEFESIIARTSLDSFLRGWPLSFVDVSLEGRFYAWITASRDAAWAGVYDQAEARGIDASALVNESTVFRAWIDGDRFIIEPCAVVNLGTTAVQKDTTRGLLIYETPWSSRTLEGLDTPELTTHGLSNLSGIDELEVAARQHIERLFNRVELAPEADQELAPESAALIEAMLLEAFALSPEEASRSIIAAVLEDVPVARRPDALALEHARILQSLYDQDGELNERMWDRLASLIDDGEWRFADTYLDFADLIRTEDPEYAERLETFARQRDSDFTAKYLAGQVDQVSDELSNALRDLSFESVKFAIQCVRELGSIAGQIETATVYDLPSIADSLEELADDIGKHDAASLVDHRVGEAIVTDVLALTTGLRRSTQPLNSLDTFIWKTDAEGIASELAANAIARFQNSMDLSRQSLEYLVELTWASGGYAAAIELLHNFAEELRRDTDDPALEQQRRMRAAVIPIANPMIVKGLVYTGRPYVIAELFSRRVTDFALRPQKPESVVPRIRWAGRGIDGPADAFDQMRLDSGSLVGRALDEFGLGDARIEAEPRSFTRTRVLRLRSDLDGESVLKLRPLDDPRSLSEARASVYLTDFLRRRGFSLPSHILPPGSGSRVKVEGKTVVTRERLAAGVELAQLRAADRSLPDGVLDEYINLTLRIAVEGRDADPSQLARASVTTSQDMRSRLSERNELARRHARIFDLASSHQEVLNSTDSETLLAFHDAMESFSSSAWRSDRFIRQTGLVHDAHLGNYFFDAARPMGQRLTVIDVGSDYIGPVGHSFAMIAREAAPAGGWTYEGFSEFVNGLIDSYPNISGIRISRQDRLDILRSMALPPYQFISSDSRSFIARLTSELDVNAQDPSFLQKAVEFGSDRLDVLLRDTEAQVKYQSELLQLEHTLRMLRDAGVPADEAEAIDALLRGIEAARRTGYRLAVNGWLMFPSFS